MRVPPRCRPTTWGGARARRAALAAALLLSAGPAAGGALAAHPPELAAETYVLAEGTSSVIVTLPTALWVPAEPTVDMPAMRVFGDARVAAVTLVAESPGAQPPGIVALGVPARSLHLRYLLVGEDPKSRRAVAVTRTLPAGRYRLTVATDKPVVIGLYLPGLRMPGNVFRTTRRTRHAAAHVPAQRVGTLASPVFAGGANGELRGTGQLIWARYQTGVFDAGSVSANCLYDGGGSETQFSVPGCPGTSSGTFVMPGSPPSVDLVQYSFLRAKAGRYGLSTYNAGPSLLDEHGLFAVWLDV